MRRANLLGKTLMLGKTEGKRRGRQDETVGWHHWLSGHEFEQTPRDSGGQRSLGSQRVRQTRFSNWTTAWGWRIVKRPRGSVCLLLPEALTSYLNFILCFINFYWNIIALQHCVSFRCTAKWTRCTHTCISSFLDFLPFSVTPDHLSRVFCAIQ